MCIPIIQFLASWAYYFSGLLGSKPTPYMILLVRQQMSWVWYYVASHLVNGVCY